MRIVFMGTPEFAVPSLEALLKSDDQVVGIVTQPDRPKGRGQQLTPSPVKLIAQREGIQILQPVKMKAPEFLEPLTAWKPDLIAVTAFGRILHPGILSLPPRGCVNVHGSLLPKYRGAAPVQWAVINGETETGITTMLMDEGMDTGPMLLQERLMIMHDDTAGTLAPRLAELGGRLLVETIAQLKAGTLTSKKQDNAQATMAPLLKKEDGLIDWTMKAPALANRVRGLSPWPGAYTFSGEERWNIWKAVSTGGATTDKPGTIVAVDKQSILVATGEGMLVVREIQTANSKRMPVSQFLSGHKVSAGIQLGLRDL
ncbi:MAG: methionyl-tRNA formyltransferase [Nitrospira sp.]|nr:methionyl-tRNA formyltransferase [Nitrospira sp.]MDH4244389.1 methionyl-tRNA formyltransferase [Nitrospira sp.]MDH4356811.1 methionyl-tRNA formyltransferase [Nitrospira sp.]MDH5318178.1 methionyl-tRNA formyltransferase [Nitrospira sp.]